MHNINVLQISIFYFLNIKIFPNHYLIKTISGET